MKIGILSGTFDPVHDGHIELAKTAVRKNIVDEVWFLPEKFPRQKQNVTSYDDRLAMLNIAAENDSNLLVKEVSQDAHSFKTLIDLIKQYPSDGFVLLIGADVSVDGWQGIEEIKERAEIKTFGRANAHADIEFSNPASSKNIREQIISGTEPENIDPKVLDYIHEHGLYQS